MTDRIRVGCVNKTDRTNAHERIASIGGRNADGSAWKLAEAAAIQGIDTGKWAFYVVRGYVTRDGASVVVQAGFDPTETSPHGLALGADAVRPAVAVIDAASGSLRRLASWDLPPAPSMWLALSDDQTAALVGPSRDGAPITGGLPISVARLDLVTGAIDANGLTLAP